MRDCNPTAVSAEEVISGDVYSVAPEDEIQKALHSLFCRDGTPWPPLACQSRFSIRRLCSHKGWPRSATPTTIHSTAIHSTHSGKSFFSGSRVTTYAPTKGHDHLECVFTLGVNSAGDTTEASSCSWLSQKRQVRRNAFDSLRQSSALHFRIHARSAR